MLYPKIILDSTNAGLVSPSISGNWSESSILSGNAIVPKPGMNPLRCKMVHPTKFKGREEPHDAEILNRRCALSPLQDRESMRKTMAKLLTTRRRSSFADYVSAEICIT